MRRSTKKALWRMACRDVARLTSATILTMSAKILTIRREPQTRRFGEKLLEALRRSA